MFAFVSVHRFEHKEAARLAFRQTYLTPFLLIVLFASHNGLAQVSNNAYQLLSSRIAANQSNFFVYQDADSGFNHGFASGYFGQIQSISVDPACVFDPASPNGCSTNSIVLDQQRGTVFRVSFSPLTDEEFAGLNFEEPEHWGENQVGQGYDLTGIHL